MSLLLLLLLRSTVLSGPPSLNKTTGRTVCSNGNVTMYNFTSTASRVHNITKYRYLATNATWTLPTLRFGWFTANQTSMAIDYPTIFFQQGIKYNGVFYEGLYSGSNYKIVAGGDEIVCSPITTPSMSGWVEIRTRIILPLLYKTKVANFTVGETVVGITSGATGLAEAVTNNSTTGSLTLSGERGTFTNNESIKGITLSGSPITITGISKAANAVITANNSFVGGESILLDNTIVGMTEIRNKIATVVSATSTTITVNINSSSFSNYSGGGTLKAGVVSGEATADLTTTQKLPFGIGAQAAFLEGNLSGQNADINYQTSDPVTTRMVAGAITINGSGAITAIATAVNGVGYSSASSVQAREVGPDGVLYIKNIGNTNTPHTSITITSGAPPTGLAAWVNPIITFSGGGDYGATTAVADCSLMEAIPSTPVCSLRLIGDSICRGFSSTDSTGDAFRNNGPYERAIANRFGVANQSASGTALANQVQFATTFARNYALFNGKCTQTLIVLGSNDATAGSSKATIQSNYNSLATHCRSFGEQVGCGTIIQRGKPLAITGISKAANAVITANNTLVGGEILTTDATIGGMTQMRSLTMTVVSATSTTITVDVDSSAFTTYTSGGFCYAISPTTSQGTDTGFDAGGIVDLHNIDVLANTVVSDFTPINLRPVWQDTTVTTAWAVTSTPNSVDLTHPSLFALGQISSATAFKAQFNQFT